MAYRKISRPPQWDNLDSLFLPHLSVPALYPALQLVQLSLDARHAHVVPQPEGRDAQDRVEPGAEGKGIKGGNQRVVDLLDELAEVVFGDQRVQDLRVQVGEGGGQVALDHPVALDADDLGGVVELAVERDVRVGVREAGVGGAPRKLGGIVAVSVGALAAASAQARAGALGQAGPPALWRGRRADGGFQVAVVDLLRCVGGCDGHGGPWGRRTGVVVVLQAGAAAGLVARQADAGAPAGNEVVAGGGALDEQRARGRALAALAALGEGQQRVLVAGRVRALDGDVGLARGGRRRGVVRRAVRRAVLEVLAGGRGRRARRAVLRIPEARGRGAWGASGRGQAAQTEAEEAVRERPAGRRGFGHRRSRSRRRGRVGGA